MKLIRKYGNVIKAIILCFLLSNMEIYVLNSNIKHYSSNKKIPNSMNHANTDYNVKLRKKIISFIQKNHRKNKTTKTNKTMQAKNQPSTEFTDQETKLMSNKLLKDGAKNGDFFNLGQKLEKKFFVPDKAIRVFNSNLFETDFKDYTEAEIRKQKEVGYTFLKEIKYGSLILGNDITINIVYKSNDLIMKTSFLPNSKISYFPLPGALNYEAKFFVVFKGEGFLYNQKFFSGEEIIITSSDKTIDAYFKKIESFMVGNNTIVDILNKNGLNDKNPNKFALRGSQNTSIATTYHCEAFIQKTDLDIIPEPQENCAVLFSDYFSNFSEDNQDKTLSICHNTDKMNSEYMIYEKDDDSTKIIVKNNKLKGKAIMSTLLPHDSTLLLFEKKVKDDIIYITATPIQEKNFIINSKSTISSKNYRYFEFLDSGCFSIFSGINFYTPLLSHCCSVKDLSSIDIKEEKTKIGSIILGKHTAISIFTEPNYQGNKFTFYSSIDNYRHFSKEAISIGSIKIHDKECELNPDPKDTESNLQGCYYIYKEENRQGKRKLICKKNIKFLTKSFKQQFEINDEERFPINSLELGNKNSVELLLSFKMHRIWPLTDLDYGYYFNKSIDKLPKIVNTDKDNLIQTLEILEPGCIILFQGKNFLGKFFKLCQDSPDMTTEDLPIDYDEFLSVVLTKNTEVVFFDLINYQNTNDSDLIFSTKESIKDLEKINVKPGKSIKFIDGKEFTLKSEIFNSGNSVTNFVIGTLEGFFSEVATKNDILSQRDKFNSCIPMGNFIDEKKDMNESNFQKNIEEYADANINMLDKFMDKGKKILTTILKWYCNFKNWLISLLIQLANTVGWVNKPLESLKSHIDSEMKGKIMNYVTDYSESDLKKENSKNIDINNNGIPDNEEMRAQFGIEARRFRTNEVDNPTNQNEYKEILRKSRKNTTTKKPKNEKKRKYKLNLVRRKFRIQITNARKGIIDSIRDGVKLIIAKVKEFFVKYVIEPIKSLGESIKKLFESIKKFFKMISEINFNKVLKCSIFGGLKIFSLFNGLSYNLLLLKATLPVPVVGPIFLLDFVLSQLCMLDYYQIAIKYFKKGLAWDKAHKDDLNNVKWTYYGTAFGNILISIAKSNGLADISLNVSDYLMNELQ